MPKKPLSERSAAAVDLGRLRWKNRTPAERVAHANMMVKARRKKATKKTPVKPAG